MAVAGGLDLHRGQLTFDYVDLGTGESWRGRISPANRDSLRDWLRRFDGTPGVEFAVEGCTGWRYVVLRREALSVRVEVRDLRLRPVAAGR
jgi:transposase